MPAGPPFKLDGAKALYATFRELPKATKRNVLMRTLRDVSSPLAAALAAKAPYETGYLASHQFVGPTASLTRRQRLAANRADRGSFVATIHIGTADPAGMMNEFGNAHQAPQPYFRGEWEARKFGMLDDIAARLGPEIEAAGARLAKKLGRG